MRVGILGTGFMGVTHALGWKKTDAELVGFAAESEAEAKPAVEQFGGSVYQNLTAMLPDVDIVDICTPTHLHYEMVLAAAKAGKHVICEKPLALTIAQGQEMVAACKKAGVKFYVAHVVRYFPEYASAYQAVQTGSIGQVATMRLRRGGFRPKKATGNWFLDEKKSGGMMLDLMIHDFDYARWIAGDVVQVFAKKISSMNPNAELDYGMAILTHQSGAISHISGAWAYPPPTFRTGLEISGDRGMIHSDSDSTAPIINYLQSKPGEAPDVGLPSSPVIESPYTKQIKEFYEGIKKDSPVRLNAEDGLAALQIALAALESARTGKAVHLTTEVLA